MIVMVLNIPLILQAIVEETDRQASLMDLHLE
jgi:hypothetical protein